MVQVVLGLQITMQGQQSTDKVAQYGLAAQTVLTQAASVLVDTELYDHFEGDTLLRVWVQGAPDQVAKVADLCQVLSAGSAMFIQLQQATDTQFNDVHAACVAHRIDSDLHEGGIAYPHTAQQLAHLMTVLG